MKKPRLVEKEKMRGLIRTIDEAINGSDKRELSFVLTVFRRGEKRISQLEIVSNDVEFEDILAVFYEVTNQVDRYEAEHGR